MSEFFDVKIAEAQEELRLVRDKLQRTSKELGEARAALSYYAHPKNYACQEPRPETGAIFQNRIIDDFDKADVRTYVGGRRARKFFEAFGEV